MTDVEFFDQIYRSFARFFIVLGMLCLAMSFWLATWDLLLTYVCFYFVMGILFLVFAMGLEASVNFNGGS